MRAASQERFTSLLRRFARYVALPAPRRVKPGGYSRGYPRHRLRYVAAAGMLVAVATAAGCSSGSSSTASSAATSSASAAASSVKTTSITIALPVAEPVQAPVYLASALGYFSKEGINAHIIVLASDTAADAALVAGSVQYTSVNAVALITADEKGVPMQDFCTEYDGPSWALAVSNSVLSSTHVTASTPLKQLLTALHGTKVAIVGTAVSAPGLILTGLLKQEGLPANWLSLVGVSASSDLTSAYTHGEVGAVFDTQPTPDQEVLDSGGKVVFNTTQLPALDQIPWEGLVGTRSYLSGNPTVDKEVCAAIGEADNYILKNPSAAASDLANTFAGLSPSLLKESLVAYKWAPNAGMTAAQWTASASLLEKYGLISPVSSSTLSGAYTTKYLPAG